MTRNQYFDTLLEMFAEHIEATDYRTEYEQQQSILAFIEKNPVPDEDGEGATDPYLGDGNFADNH